MPRSSRHKSHRSEKHGSRDGRDRSDSDDDRNSKEKKSRSDEPTAAPSSRVSRDGELEKVKPSLSSQSVQGKDPISASNGDLSGEHGRKRKERAENPVVSDRWNGGSEDDHTADKKTKGEVCERVDMDKAAKLKLSTTDSKGRPSRRQGGSGERNEESGGKVELAKPSSEKDSSRREGSGSQYKDLKESGRDYNKDAKERDSDCSKDAKERDRDCSKDAKERVRDHSKDAKERDIDHYKDAKEKERDYYKDAKEKDRDYYKDAKERGRGYSKDAKDRDKDYSKDPKERDREYYKDPRERDRDYSKGARERDRGRGSDRDNRGHDAQHERSDDAGNRKQATNIKISGSEEEHVAKKNMEISGGQIQDNLRNPEPEKELDKHVNRRDISGDKEKCLGDGRDGDERRLSSKDDHTKSSSYKDESLREGWYRDKYKENLDKDQRHRDDKCRDDRSSRDHDNSRSGNKHFRDENRPSESRYKKSKIQPGDHDGSLHVDDHGTKLKDNRGRKRFSDENDDHIDSRPRGAKELREDVDKNTLYTSKYDPHTDRARLDYLHAGKVDSSLDSNRPKSSPSSSNHAGKDQSRPSTKQAGPSSKKLLPEETLRPSTASRGDHSTVSGIHERVGESRSLEKTRPKEDGRLGELLEVAASHHDRTPKSDARASPNTLAEKSPADRQFSDKIGAKRSLDIEEGQKSSSSKDGRECSNLKDKERERALPLEKSISDDLSQVELPNNEPASSGLSSFNRTSHLSGSSPSHLPPPPLVRRSPSVLGSFEDDNRVQIGERKTNSRYKRGGEHSMGRGQGNVWKSAPAWPSPVANGFIPLQHGPPPSGFHPAIQQFPAPYFGVRPSMDLNRTGGSYHVHEAADRFSRHGHPFGWHNPVDDCPPHLQVWDGSNGVFGDESHVYGRPEWDMNRHLMGSRGWEMNSGMRKGQNGSMNMELPVPQESEYSTHALADEAWAEQTGQQSRTERAPSEHLPADNSEVKQLNDKSLVKNGVETQKNLHEKSPGHSKTSVLQTAKIQNDDNNVRFVCNYLSKLEISLGLVQPELYKQCMSLSGTRDVTSVDNVSKRGFPQNNKEDARVAAKSTKHILTSLFPTGMDAVFKRAMSIYKKPNEGRKVTYPTSPSVCPEEKDSLEFSEEKMKGGDKQPTSADTSPVEEMMATDNQASADALLANADSATNMGENNTATDVEGSHPGDAMEQQCDSTSEAVPFVEGSQSCEALMAECGLNLSRIHLSPGSTH